jgi:hypothetical protein
MIMKLHFAAGRVALAVAGAALAASAANAQWSDTKQASTGYFVPSVAQEYDAPYYRSSDEDWGWTHTAYAGTFTSASLNISAFDVDFDQGEIDNIYVNDSGTWVLVGSLGGGSDIYSFTNFVLGANFYDDIAAGLQVKVDIDIASAGWALTLSKSVLSLDGAELPDADPGVPEPASWALMLGGFGLVGATMRRRRTAVSFG